MVFEAIPALNSTNDDNGEARKVRPLLYANLTKDVGRLCRPDQAVCVHVGFFYDAQCISASCGDLKCQNEIRQVYIAVIVDVATHDVPHNLELIDGAIATHTPKICSVKREPLNGFGGRGKGVNGLSGGMYVVDLAKGPTMPEMYSVESKTASKGSGRINETDHVARQVQHVDGFKKTINAPEIDSVKGKT